MGLIDFILNLAGLLLWLNWRSLSPSATARPTTRSLLGTLQPVRSSRGRSRWLLLAGLGALLVVRAVFYWQVGSMLHWTPHLSLGATSPAFWSQHLPRMLVFSVLSFAVTLGTFYLWLLPFAIAHRHLPDTDPQHHLVRLYLGRLDDFPTTLKLLMPFAVMTLAWLGVHPLLSRLGVVPSAKSLGTLLQQAIVVGLASYLAWKYLLVGVLLLHLVHSYVYLGNSPFWTYVSVTARHLLKPLEWLPLRAGRVDLAPLVGLGIVLLLTEILPGWLAALYEHPPF